MIEGKGSKDHIKTKTFMLNYPQVFKKLIVKIQDATIEYLSKQIEGGVDVIKLFDSWANSLPATYIEKYSLEPMKVIAKEIKKDFQIYLLSFFHVGLVQCIRNSQWSKSLIV